MIDYTGIPCPVCHKEFTSDDDIVVCPECGAPYHRECYQSVGHCIYTDKHGTDEAWKPPQKQQEEPHTENGESSQEDNHRIKPCPRCGAQNYKDALFCDKCGFPLSADEARPGGFPFPGAGAPGQPPMGGMPFVAFDPLGGVNPTEDFDGVPASDVAKLVGPSTPYYLPVFDRIKKTNKGKFSFSAFLFSGGWMLYRKQYKYGILVCLLMVACIIANLAAQVFVWWPMIESLNLTDSQIYSMEYIPLLIQEVSSKDFGAQLLFYIPLIADLIRWALHFIVGFQGNRFYYRHCVDTVKKINGSAASEEARVQKLQSDGGVNVPLAICLLVGYMIVSYLPYFL